MPITNLHAVLPIGTVDRRPSHRHDRGIDAAIALPTIQISIAATLPSQRQRRPTRFPPLGLVRRLPARAGSARAPARKGRHPTTLNSSRPSRISRKADTHATSRATELAIIRVRLGPWGLPPAVSPFRLWSSANMRTSSKLQSLAVILIAATTLLASCGKNDTVSQAEKKDVAKGIAAPNIEETKAIAEQGFIYGLPLVMNYAVMYEYAVDTKLGPVQGALQPDQERSSSRSLTRTRRSSRPTATRLIRLLWLDLRAEPMVISVPAVERRATTRCS